jgi:hypothetical protein
MAVGAKSAVHAPPIAIPLRSLTCRWTRDELSSFGFRRASRFLRVSELLFEALVFFVEFVSLGSLVTVAAPTASPSAPAAGRAAAAAGPPAIVVLCPASPGHRSRRVVVRRWWHASSAVMAGQRVACLGNGKHCPCTLSPPTKAAVPRRLSRGDGGAMAPLRVAVAHDAAELGMRRGQKARKRGQKARAGHSGRRDHPSPGLPSGNPVQLTVALPTKTFTK